jgi:lysophospholipase L1-like esterase
MRIILFGDSIAFGKGDPENGGWAGHMRRYIDMKEKKNVFTNLSISWETSRGLLGRLEKEATLRIGNRPPEEFTIMIAIGVNDSGIKLDGSEEAVSEEEFKKNIGEIIQVSSRLASQTMIIGLLPVNQELTSPFRGKTNYSNVRIESYNQILRECAAEKGISFKDFLPAWRNNDLKELLDDGLHPNKIGHLKVYGAIRDFLEKLN